MRVLRLVARGALVGMAVVTSCSGGRTGAQQGDVDLAAAAVSSPCGGGDLQPLSETATAVMREGFESWPLPPVYVSELDLDDDAVACFDGVAVLVHRDYAQDRVIVAHEYCHAVASLKDLRAPEGFPLPEPRTARARALESHIWKQEIWAVSCSTAVTGERDWSWGHLVDDSTEEAQRWAGAYIAAGPTSDVTVPRDWTIPVPVPQRP